MALKTQNSVLFLFLDERGKNEMERHPTSDVFWDMVGFMNWSGVLLGIQYIISVQNLHLILLCLLSVLRTQYGNTSYKKEKV